MTSLKHAFKVDVSPITAACALLAREAWDTDEPDSRDHWKAAALKARVHADGLANELSRLRELEVKWLRVRHLLARWDGDAEVDGDEPLSTRANELHAAMAADVTEADLERFRNQVRR